MLLGVMSPAAYPEGRPLRTARSPFCRRKKQSTPMFAKDGGRHNNSKENTTTRLQQAKMASARLVRLAKITNTCFGNHYFVIS